MMTEAIPRAKKISMMFIDMNPYYTPQSLTNQLTKKDRHSFLVLTAANPIAEVRIRNVPVNMRSRHAV